MEPITRFPDDALTFLSPRQWGCERKIEYRSRGEARRHRPYPRMGTYRCQHCGQVHRFSRKSREEIDARMAGTEA